MTRILNLATTVLSLAAIPLASGAVEEWSGRILGTDYTITGDVNVTILADGTFKFQAEDGGGNLDVIGNITVADGVTGTVIVYIERDTDDDSPGATNVGSINLTNDQGASLTGNLAELRITGDLATANDVVCDSITGTVVCGDVDNDITIQTSLTGTMTANDITGTITIVEGRLNGSLTANTLGDVDLQGRVAHPSRSEGWGRDSSLAPF